MIFGVVAYTGAMLEDPAEPESMDAQVDDDVEDEWRQEIYRRLQQIDIGAVKLIPWDDAQRRLWARLHA